MGKGFWIQNPNRWFSKEDLWMSNSTWKDTQRQSSSGNVSQNHHQPSSHTLLGCALSKRKEINVGDNVWKREHLCTVRGTGYWV